MLRSMHARLMNVCSANVQDLSSACQVAGSQEGRVGNIRSEELASLLVSIPDRATLSSLRALQPAAFVRQVCLLTQHANILPEAISVGQSLLPCSSHHTLVLGGLPMTHQMGISKMNLHAMMEHQTTHNRCH